MLNMEPGPTKSSNAPFPLSVVRPCAFTVKDSSFSPYATYAMPAACTDLDVIHELDMDEVAGSLTFRPVYCTGLTCYRSPR